MRRASQVRLGGLRFVGALIVSAGIIPAVVAGCSSQPSIEQVHQQQADESRLELVDAAIQGGQEPAGGTLDEGGGDAIVRTDEPFASIRLGRLRPGRFTVKALCLGHGTVRVSVAPGMALGPTDRAATSTPSATGTVSRAGTVSVRCGFSETYFGSDIATGVLGSPVMTVAMRAVGQADGAVAFRIREP